MHVMRFATLTVPSILFAAALGYGCAEDGGDPLEPTPDATPARISPDTGAEDVEDTPQDATKPDAKKPQPKTDAGKQPLPPEGSPCNSAVTPIQEEPCGKCGTHNRACLPSSAGDAGLDASTDASGADAGTVWGAWGSCQGEVVTADACDPAQTYADKSCGNCGKQKQLCGVDCHFDSTSVCQEPANACRPGATEWLAGASCSNTNEGRTRSCDNTCAWGGFSATCVPEPPNVLVISSSAGLTQEVNATFHLTAGKVLPLLNAVDWSTFSNAACPTTVDTTTSTPYTYVELQNPTAQTATVSVWTKRDPNNTSITSLVVAAYPGAVAPANSDNTARGACIGNASAECYKPAFPECDSSTMSGMYNDPGFSPTDPPFNTPVTILPNSSVMIYVAADSATQDGAFQLWVRTDALK